MRRLRRSVQIARALSGGMMRFGQLRCHQPLTLQQRAVWLQQTARLVLQAMEIDCFTTSLLPRNGLIVANHLSYLDILVVAATMPCCFVAKREVGDWPIFGAMADMAGTIFLDRGSLSSARAAANEVAARLQAGVAVVLFPEGTSSDGSDVLPFRPRLLRPAIEAGATITSAAIRYATGPLCASPGVEQKVCWYGDQGLVPHLWKTLGVDRIAVQVRFGTARTYSDTRTAAAIAHGETRALRRFAAMSSF